jgi:CheY-like chemotaxis protein
MMSGYALLCVDDEAVILTSLKEQLRSHFGKKFIYESATSGSEAIEILDELQDEAVQTVVIVSDFLMPEMKGDELLIEIHHRFPTSIKIMLTGQADPVAVERTKREGDLFGFIQKPWSKEQLISLIEQGLKERWEKI